MDEMVFCNKCEHFEKIAGYKKDKFKYVCKAPENCKDNWMGKGNEYIGRPQDRNKNNDCSDYKKNENF